MIGSRSRNHVWIGMTLALASAPWPGAHAQDAKKAEEPPVAAVVNGDPLYVAEVDGALALTAKRRHATPNMQASAKAEMLRQLIDRRLVEVAIKRDGGYVQDAEIEKELAKTKAAVQAQRLSL